MRIRPRPRRGGFCRFSLGASLVMRTQFLFPGEENRKGKGSPLLAEGVTRGPGQPRGEGLVPRVPRFLTAEGENEKHSQGAEGSPFPQPGVCWACTFPMLLPDLSINHTSQAGCGLGRWPGRKPIEGCYFEYYFFNFDFLIQSTSYLYPQIRKV